MKSALSDYRKELWEKNHKCILNYRRNLMSGTSSIIPIFFIIKIYENFKKKIHNMTIQNWLEAITVPLIYMQVIYMSRSFIPKHMVNY